MRLSLAGLVFVGLLGCPINGPAAGSPDFTEIRIESHPRGWGYAHKTVKPDGSITGGHMSGRAGAPRVFESTLQVTPQDMSTLRALVGTVVSEPTNEKVSLPDQKLEGYTSVVIALRDGTATTAYAKRGQRFRSKSIQTIWDILSNYRAGAW